MALGQRIGLEIHIYPRTGSKMYCDCSADFLSGEPNSSVCPICSGQPGSKPMRPNLSCIRAGILIARALSMQLSAAPIATMRKHYFYPDLPSNYQRTAEPLAIGGKLHGFALTEIHWEEDPGQYDIQSGEVDLNRSGVPLLELVTEPVMHSADDARAALSDLLLLLQYLDISRADAPFKVDTNISVDGGERVEVKNINSINGVVKALEFEYSRQSSLVGGGGTILQETRHFDEVKLQTFPMRYKETSEDYRYMRDPDILPVDIASIAIRELENPFHIMERMLSGGVREEDARVILADRRLLQAFNAISRSTRARYASIFVSNDIRSELAFRNLDPSYILEQDRLEQLSALAQAHSGGLISNQTSTSLLRKLFDGTRIADELAGASGSFASGSGLSGAVSKVIAANPSVADKYRRGNREVINYLVGACMKELGGKARAGDILSELRKALGE